MAERLGWRIADYRIKHVNVANNEPMYVTGAAYLDLNVGGRIVESDILITPDIGSLILGIDWLRRQGRFRWDFEKGQIRFGEEDWIELRQETKSIRRIRPELSDIREEDESFSMSAIDRNTKCVSVWNRTSECKSELDSTSAYVCADNLNSISTSDLVGGVARISTKSQVRTMY